MRKTLAISNLIALIITVIFNYVSNTGIINGHNIGEVSHQYPTLITPADYAFSIWGLIYLMLFLFVGYGFKGRNSKDESFAFIERTGWWFVLSCVANCLWIVCFLNEWMGLSALVIFFHLFTLIKIILLNRMELDDKPFDQILFLWWPFMLYGGWITVATIVSVATFLVSIEWSAWGIHPETWTIIMILVAGIINLLVTWTRNMREFALVGAWGLWGIAVANAQTNPNIEITAQMVAILLIISSFTHAYINRATNPFVKYQQYREASNGESL